MTGVQTCALPISGFEKDNEKSGVPGYENIVADAWRKRNTISSSISSNDNSSNDLDIPTFLRKNKMGK